MTIRIRLLGEPAIFGADGSSNPIRGFQAWALLARVLMARAPIDRRSLAMELFPDTADPLGSLRWCLAALRGALGSPDYLKGDPIEHGFGDEVEVDVWRLADDDVPVEDAGQLLGGLEPRASAEFATWLLVERERTSARIDVLIRQGAIRALAVDDHERAIRLCELAVRRDGYSESGHVLLVKSLTLAGRHEAATAHVEATEALFLAELGRRPNPALRHAVRRPPATQHDGISTDAFVNSMIRAGLAALAAGATDTGIDCLRRAVHDAEKAQDRFLLARATLELGTALVHACRSQDDEGAVTLNRSADCARQTGQNGIAASAYRELGYVEAIAGRRPSAAVYLDQATRLASSDDTLAGIYAVSGFNLADWGRLDEGIAAYETALEHARRAGNMRREIWSLGLGAWALVHAGRLDEAEAWLTLCQKLVRESGWIAFSPWPTAVLAELRLAQGADPRGLQPDLEEAFTLACQMGDSCWEGSVGRAIALTHAAAGDDIRALDWLADAYRRCVRDTDPFTTMQVEILASKAEISRRIEDPEMAEAAAREWVGLAARTHMNSHVTRAAAFISGR